MANKILSIIIPSCNMEKYLDRCLSSLMVDDAEILAKLEVIVVNDGSKDRTSEIAHGYEETHPGIVRVIDKPNGHYGSCINAALPTVQGEYVKILDADDRYNTREFATYLKWAEEKLSTNPPDLLINDVLTSDANKNYNIRYGYNLPKGENFSAEYLFSHMPMLQIHCIAYRSKIFEGLGYRQTEGVPYTDLEWDTFPLMRVESAAYCPEAVYHYYLGRVGQSMDINVQRKNFAVSLKLLQSAIRFAENVTCADYKRRHLDLYIESGVAGSYMNPLLILDRKSALAHISSVDSTIREVSSSWYDRAALLKYPRSTPFGFRYVAAFRKGKVGSCYIAALRFARWLMEVVRKLKMTTRRLTATACTFEITQYEE